MYNRITQKRLEDWAEAFTVRERPKSAAKLDGFIVRLAIEFDWLKNGRKDEKGEFWIGDRKVDDFDPVEVRKLSDEIYEMSKSLRQVPKN